MKVGWPGTGHSYGGIGAEPPYAECLAASGGSDSTQYPTTLHALESS